MIGSQLMYTRPKNSKKQRLTGHVTEVMVAAIGTVVIVYAFWSFQALPSIAIA
jgi:hypothetical protein